MNIPDTVPLLQTAKVLPQCKELPTDLRNDHLATGRHPTHPSLRGVKCAKGKVTGSVSTSPMRGREKFRRTAPLKRNEFFAILGGLVEGGVEGSGCGRQVRQQFLDDVANSASNSEFRIGDLTAWHGTPVPRRGLIVVWVH